MRVIGFMAGGIAKLAEQLEEHEVGSEGERGGRRRR